MAGDVVWSKISDGNRTGSIRLKRNGAGQIFVPFVIPFNLFYFIYIFLHFESFELFYY